MKRVLFLVSHLCSGSNSLYWSLNRHPRIQGFRGNHVYENRHSLVLLTSQPHKLGDASAIYMDELVFNSSMSSRQLYSEGKHIFLVREPVGTINELMHTRNYGESAAISHYCSRLQRMCSIAAKSPDSVLLTFADLSAGNGSELICNYLGLRNPVNIPGVENMNIDKDLAGIAEADDAYESCLCRLKSLGLKSIP